MATFTVVLRLALTLLTVAVHAQAPQDPLSPCRRYGHQTAVIDRKLYIDGGWVYANPIAQNPVPTISKCFESLETRPLTILETKA